MPALLTRRVGSLLRLHLLQHGGQPLVVDNRAGLHCLDLVEQLEAERRSFELNCKPPVRVVHHVDLLAHQSTRQRRRVQQQHHAVVVQGQVLRDSTRLPRKREPISMLDVCGGRL
jgi:hypothetical protein